MVAVKLRMVVLNEGWPNVLHIRRPYISIKANGKYEGTSQRKEIGVDAHKRWQLSQSYDFITLLAVPIIVHGYVRCVWNKHTRRSLTPKQVRRSNTDSQLVIGV